MKKHIVDHFVKDISYKIKKPKKKTAGFYLALIFTPSILLVDEMGKDKSGIILTAALALLILVTLITLIATGKFSGFCLIGYVAINVWGWLLYGMSRSED